MTYWKSFITKRGKRGKLMSTPWPDDAYDCALRLAHSLGYREINISAKDDRVYVNYPMWSADWRELDPRDPTVWGALIGINGIEFIEFFNGVYLQEGKFYSGSFLAGNKRGWAASSVDIGIAVCEAYNALKGNPRWVND